MKNNKGLTLIELMIVIIILGILATIALVNMRGSTENAYNREAQANLKMISAGEKMYRLENNGYIACANLTVVNTLLRLSISTTNPNWNYTVGNIGLNTFCVQATRTLAPVRWWSIRPAQDEPILSPCP